MNAPMRLSLYGLVLVLVFAVSGFTANAVISEETVQNWTEDSAEVDHDDQGASDRTRDAPTRGEHEGHASNADSAGLASAQEGYQLTEITAPAEAGTNGELSLALTGPDGTPVTDFDLDHEQEMHLIAVRADGQHFRHVHPEHDGAGTWAIPWEWEEAGTYRIFADFIPTETDESLTLSTTVQVLGDYEPVPPELTTETTVDGFDVAVEGDLAYLHVHPHGAAPEAEETGGPEIVFEATAPTEGRYLLYLDFQVDGQVHTASMVLDAADRDHDEDGNNHDH